MSDYLSSLPYRVPKESTVEEYLTEQVEARGGMCEKFVSPGKRGVPDRLVSWPAYRFSAARVHFVELKRSKGGRIYDWQTRDHNRRRGMGFVVEVLYTKQMVDDYLRTCEHAGICHAPTTTK